MHSFTDLSDVEYERYFSYAAVWAFGGTLNVQHRESFSNWWRSQFDQHIDYPEDGTVSKGERERLRKKNFGREIWLSKRNDCKEQGRNGKMRRYGKRREDQPTKVGKMTVERMTLCLHLALH